MLEHAKAGMPEKGGTRATRPPPGMTPPLQGVDHPFLGMSGPFLGIVHSSLRGGGRRRGVGGPLFGGEGLLVGWLSNSAEWSVHSQAGMSYPRTCSAVPKSAPPAPKREWSIPQSGPSAEWNRRLAGGPGSSAPRNRRSARKRGSSAPLRGNAIPGPESSIPSGASRISRTASSASPCG